MEYGENSVCVEYGECNMASVIWRVEFGERNLASGIWRVVYGEWYMVSVYMCNMSKICCNMVSGM